MLILTVYQGRMFLVFLFIRVVMTHRHRRFQKCHLLKSFVQTAGRQLVMGEAENNWTFSLAVPMLT